MSERPRMSPAPDAPNEHHRGRKKQKYKRIIKIQKASVERRKFLRPRRGREGVREKKADVQLVNETITCISV